LQEIDNQLTPSGAELGTAHYMSPEQARGTRNVDPRSDVYALGAILYEALTGARAHPGDSYNAVIFHLLTQPHRPLKELLPTCPDELHAIVERCLERDPRQRYADAGELTDELTRMRGQTADTSSAQGSGLGLRRGVNGRPPGRVSWLVAGAALGALVTASIGAIVLGDAGPGARGSFEAARGASASVPSEQLTSTHASLLTREAERAAAPLVELPASGTSVAQPLLDVEPAVEASTPTVLRKPPSANVKGSTSPALAETASGGAPQNAAPLRESTDSTESSAGSSATPAPDRDAVPAHDSFPFVTSNPYGAN
jgi:hypothetical protein